MDRNDIRYQAYIDILNEELIPAMGCTEPIALAYAAAIAVKELGSMPDRILVEASGSIIKNTKSVVVPNTDGMKGIPAAVLAGTVCAQPDKKLEVLSVLTKDSRAALKQAMTDIPVDIQLLDKGQVFDILITEYCGEDNVSVRITGYHTNVVRIEKNGAVIFSASEGIGEQAPHTDRSLLTMEGIWDFITTVDTDEIREVLERQISYNMAIAEEGLKNDYGANIGKVLLADCTPDVITRAKAYAAAGSDARMDGCELPVVINSGSGNQGITCCVPVVIYAEEYNVSREMLLRALALSNLTAIHEKTGIGTLSAYCGAVSAGAGAGAGIAYVTGGDYRDVVHTIVNSLAVVSGMICDGAKPSCAAKIAASIDSAILGLKMYRHHQQFRGGDGIVVKGVENTISNVGRLGHDGMKETNIEIIDMMINGK